MANLTANKHFLHLYKYIYGSSSNIGWNILSDELSEIFNQIIFLKSYIFSR